MTGENVALKCDTIVLVGARQPVELAKPDALRKAGLEEVHIAGDCLVPGTIQAAVLSGHETARAILRPSEEPIIYRRDQIAFPG